MLKIFVKQGNFSVKPFCSFIQQMLTECTQVLDAGGVGKDSQGHFAPVLYKLEEKTDINLIMKILYN